MKADTSSELIGIRQAKNKRKTAAAAFWGDLGRILG
jgi:hypothetical protein